MSLTDISPGKFKILKAVSSLLEDPAAKVTINRIAAAVHVTEAAIYRHYRSKEEIFTALVGYMETNLLDPLQGMDSQAPASIKLESVFHQYMDFLEGHPGLARLFLGHGATEATGIAERIKLLSARMRSQVAQCLRQDQSSLQKGIEPEQVVEIFYGLVVGAAMAQTYGFPQISAQARWQAFSATVFAAAEAKAA